MCVTLTESAPMTMRTPLFCKINLKKINKATIYSNIAPLRCSNSSVNEYRLWLFSLLENSLVSGWQLTFETIWDRRPNE